MKHFISIIIGLAYIVVMIMCVIKIFDIQERTTRMEINQVVYCLSADGMTSQQKTALVNELHSNYDDNPVVILLWINDVLVQKIREKSGIGKQQLKILNSKLAYAVENNADIEEVMRIRQLISTIQAQYPVRQDVGVMIN